MGTAAWVCFDCRSAVRRSTLHTGAVPCPRCGKASVYLGYKTPVPPARKRRVWDALRESLGRARREQARADEVAAVGERHALEKRLATLENRTPVEGRLRAITLLRKRLGRR